MLPENTEPHCNYKIAPPNPSVETPLSRFSMVQVFQGPGFSGSRFKK